jgi:hypothetical protein
MKVDKIYYQRNFPIGEFMYAHYGVGISIDDGESIEDAYAEAKKIIRSQYENDNPHIVWSEAPVPATVIEEKSSKGTLEDQIMGSKDINELNTWKLISLSHPRLLEVYNNRLSQLKQ